MKRTFSVHAIKLSVLFAVLFSCYTARSQDNDFKKRDSLFSYSTYRWRFTCCKAVKKNYAGDDCLF